MPKHRKEIDDRGSNAFKRRRVYAFLKRDVGTAYSDEEIADATGIERVPPMHMFTGPRPLNYESKTDAGGTEWHYLKPNWYFWGVATVVALAIGYNIFWQLKPGLRAAMPIPIVGEFVASMVGVMPIAIVMMVYDLIVRDKPVFTLDYWLSGSGRA